MEIFSEDGSTSESELKLVIDQGREAMKIARPVAISRWLSRVPCVKRTRNSGPKRANILRERELRLAINEYCQIILEIQS